ncbi:MAG: peptidyl-prolyl cis-trans isomerase [bacterium]|nr:MAG: peptidyl-prolyl cis-trans isomerase [bacterium]
MRRTILVLGFVAMLVSVGCTKREDLVVAEIGVKKITVGDIERASEVLEEKYLPATDDLAGKKSVLEHVINKEVMALKARAAGYEKEEWFANFWQQFKGPFLVAAMMDEFIRKKVEVTEEEVDEYYEQMKYEYTLSQIVVPEEDDAWEIRDQILAGADFAEMARIHSLGVAANEGGFVGASPVGKIIWWVEEALFEMKEGDISKPLRTQTGYAILKLHKKRKITPENDREYARQRIRAVKEKKGIDAFKAKIDEEIGLTFFPDAVTIAFESLPGDIKFEDIVSYKVTRRNAPKLNIPEQYKDMPICQYADVTFTLEDFEETYESLGLPERPRRVYGRENIIQVMHKRVFDSVLPEYAVQTLKILEIPEVNETLEKRKEQFLVYQFYQQQIKEDVTVTEREIETYYNDNKEQLIKSEMRDFSIILVSDRDKANEVMIRARGGANFNRLVRDFTEDRAAKENYGQTGLVLRGQYPEYDETAFSLENVGDISDPIKTTRGWAVIRLNEIQPERTPTLAEATQAIRTQIMEERAETLLQEKLQSWREDYIIKRHEGNLAKVELKRTRL